MKQQKQKGMALTGWLIVITLFGFSLTIFLKLFPVYLEDYAVKQAFEKAAQDPEFKNQTPQQVRDHFNKYLGTNSISVISADKLVISETENKRNLTLDYEVRKHFIGNIDLILSFHYQESVPTPT